VQVKPVYQVICKFLMKGGERLRAGLTFFAS